MNDNQDDFDYGPVRKYRRGNNTEKGPLIALCILAVVVVISIVMLVLAITGKLDGLFSGKPAETKPNPDAETEEQTDTQSPDQTGSSETGGSEVTSPETIGGSILWDFKDYSPEDVAKGDLVLIDATHPYTFPTSGQSIVNVYGNKINLYGLSTTAVQLDATVITQINAMVKAFYEETGSKHADLMLQSGYRTYEAQKELFDKYYAKYGDSASTFTLPAGCSDYHTGKSFYMKVCTVLDETNGDGTNKKSVREIADCGGDYAWIGENAHKYGFIMRYPAEKTAYTGTVTDGEGHFRYVGIPHAYAMHQNNWCLEEYLEQIRSYTYTGDHLKVSDSTGTQYEIFYVPAAVDGITRLPLPSNAPYTVSGNNIDGFIVSVEVK